MFWTFGIQVGLTLLSDRKGKLMDPLGGIYQGSIEITWVPLKNYVAACVDGRSNKLSTPVDSTTLHDPKSLSTLSLEICYYSSLKSLAELLMPTASNSGNIS